MILSGRPPKALVYLSTTEHMYICTPLAHLDADCLHNANNFVAMYCICTQGATYTVYDGKVKNTQCTCRELPMLVIETRVNMTPTIRRALLKTKHFPLVFTDHSISFTPFRSISQQPQCCAHYSGFLHATPVWSGATAVFREIFIVSTLAMLDFNIRLSHRTL